MTRTYGFLILLFACSTAFAQDYVITSKGDSLAGDLKIFTMGADKKVMVNENKKKTYVALFQVKEFRYKDEMYKPVKGPAGYTFMKLVKPGYLSLFAFQLENQVTYDGLYLQKKDGSGIEVPNLGFKKAMKKFLTECPAVSLKLDTDVYGRKDLTIIIDEYNACIAGNTAAQNRALAQIQEQTKKSSPWESLREKVEAADFSGKADALEMIDEIRKKISRSEKVPNFMIEGLKSSLSGTTLQTELDAALNEIR